MKNDNNESKQSSCLILFLFVITVAGGFIMNGWVLSVLWGWFVVPLFNIAPLTIPYAIGISTIFAMFVSKNKTMKDDKKYGSDDLPKIIESIAYVFLTPLIVLFIGYIVTLFL